MANVVLLSYLNFGNSSPGWLSNNILVFGADLGRDENRNPN
jgi:hypothetical protein